jgi:hypothetical protein
VSPEVIEFFLAPLVKRLLICMIFKKAAGVLKHNSYWFKGFRKPIVPSQKSFQKPLAAV